MIQSIRGQKDNGKLSLSDAKEGGIYVMLEVNGGHIVRQRLYSMGLNPGVRFKVMTNVGRGPVGLEVRNTKLAIGRGMAHKIIVRENGS